MAPKETSSYQTLELLMQKLEEKIIIFGYMLYQYYYRLDINGMQINELKKSIIFLSISLMSSATTIAFQNTELKTTEDLKYEFIMSVSVIIILLHMFFYFKSQFNSKN